jgi:hypothetical protein
MALLPCGETVIQRVLEMISRHLYGPTGCSCGHEYPDKMQPESGYRLHVSNLLHGSPDRTVTIEEKANHAAIDKKFQERATENQRQESAEHEAVDRRHRPKKKK